MPKRALSKGEETLNLHIRAIGETEYRREFIFLKYRNHRFDFAFYKDRLGVEVEGVVYDGKGRHQTAAGYANDCEKYNLALLNGWIVLRFTQNMVKSGMAITQIEQMLKIIRQRDTDSKHRVTVGTAKRPRQRPP